MTSTGQVGIDDKLLMGKSVRAAGRLWHPVCHTTSTGMVGMGDKIIEQSVRLENFFM